MQDQALVGLRVAILATDGFEQVELTGPRDAFQAAGATIMVLSPKPDKIQGFNHDEKGASVAVDIPLERADAGDYDALLLPGGAMNADALRMEPQAQAFVRYPGSRQADRRHLPRALAAGVGGAS